MTRRLQGYGRATVESREEVKRKKQRLKDKFEFNNKGDYEIIYPLRSAYFESNHNDHILHEAYDNLIRHTQEIWTNATKGFALPKKPPVQTNNLNMSYYMEKQAATEVQPSHVKKVGRNSSAIHKDRHHGG